MNDELIGDIRSRAQNPKTINDMAEGVSPPYVLPSMTTAEKIAGVEARLGFALPELLRRLYTEVADGGFGPGYGLVGIEGDRNSYLGSSLADSYDYYLKESNKEFGVPWQPKLLPILTWGCGIVSCVDCANPSYPVYFLDPGDHCLDDPGLEVTLELADGTVKKLDGFPEMNDSKPQRDDKPQGLQLRKGAGSFEEFMGKWAAGLSLWNEMMGEG
jgi:hypothetical protein